jgi:hypothetical protein
MAMKEVEKEEGGEEASLVMAYVAVVGVSALDASVHDLLPMTTLHTSIFDIS